MLSASDFSICIISFNGMATLPGTLEGLRWAYAEGVSVYLIDDGSTDDSPAWVAEHFPMVRVTSMGKNTRQVNRVRNQALREPTTPYVMLLDNDILLERAAVETLAAAMASRPFGKPVLCCTPRLVYHDDLDKIYMDGAAVSYLFVSTQTVRGVSVSARSDLRPQRTIGSGIMWIDREAALAVGGFNEDILFGWGSDGEFHMRGRLLGYDAVHVPAAVAAHVEKVHGRDRIYSQFRNRYRVMLTYLEARTLAVVWPMLLLFEVMISVAALVGGFWRERWRGLRDVWSQRRSILAARRHLQQRRRVSDRFIFEGGRMGTVGKPDKSKLIGMAASMSNLLFEGYWRLVTPLLSRHDGCADAGTEASLEVQEGAVDVG